MDAIRIQQIHLILGSQSLFSHNLKPTDIQTLHLDTAATMTSTSNNGKAIPEPLPAGFTPGDRDVVVGKGESISRVEELDTNQFYTNQRLLRL